MNEVMAQYTEGNLRFRCYNPVDKELKKFKLPKPNVVRPEIKVDTEIIKMDNVTGQIDLNILAPKRYAFDLKRDIRLELEELDVQTKKAVRNLEDTS
jgi:hypothetical protein